MATDARSARITIGPTDHGRRMTLDEFIDARWTEGWLYELARGVVVVTEVPGTPHGRIVRRVARMFDRYDDAHPDVIRYAAGGMECRIRLPEMTSDRHPDQAIYLTPEPSGKRIWTRWVPALVVEVVSKGKAAWERDYVEKREEYLRFGVLEYWIIDRFERTKHVFRLDGDAWAEVVLADREVHRTDLLPGLGARVGELLGIPESRPGSDDDEDDDDDE